MSHSMLQATLRGVITNRLGISGAERHDVTQISERIAASLQKEFQKTVEELRFSTIPEKIGSMADELKIPGKKECDYLFYVDVSASFGTLQLEGAHGNDGYFKVIVHNPVPKMNKMIVPSGGRQYLSPIKVHAFMLGHLTRILNAQPTRAPFGIYEVHGIVSKTNQAGPNLLLQITYSGVNGLETFDMDFSPSLHISGRILVAKPHPSLKQPMHELNRNDATTLRWRQTMGPEETKKIAPLDKGDGGMAKQVCRLVKYLAKTHPQFRSFNSYIYKTVFLHLLGQHEYPREWRENKLADRFLDFMKFLENALLRGELYHYFLLTKYGIKRNLLRPRFSDTTLATVGNYVAGMNRRQMAGQAAYAEIFQ